MEKTCEERTRSDRMKEPREIKKNPWMGTWTGCRWSPGRSLRAIGPVGQKLWTCECSLKSRCRGDRVNFDGQELSQYTELWTCDCRNVSGSECR